MNGIIAFAGICGILTAIISTAKRKHMEKQLEKLTEQMSRFLIHFKEPLEENLEEGYFVNFYNDIAQMEHQLLLERGKRDGREQEISSFVENIAHQIMNAITALQIQIDILQLSSDDTTQKNIDKAQLCIERMRSEMDRILKSSQLASGKIYMIYEPLDIAEEVQRSMEKLSPLAEQKKVQLRLDCKEKCTLSGDLFWLSQALENVIKNAIEHTAFDSSVVITVSDKKRTVHIRIEDEGEGIAPDQQAELFTRFSRGITEKKGYGIGLSMAKDIVNAHHGTIAAGNRSKKGAWFEISIPVLQGAGVYF